MEKKTAEITEKIAIIGDLHLAPRCENASIRNAVVSGQEAYIDRMIADIRERGITKAVFCGDLFTTRAFISVSALEYAIDLFRNKLKDIECYVIAGNHDLEYDNSSKHTSIRFLELLPNVHVFVDTIGKAKLAGKQFFFVPWVQPDKFGEVNSWLEKLSTKASASRQNTVLVGHFDIFGALMEAGQVSQGGFEPDKFTNAAGLTVTGHYHCRSEIIRDKANSKIVYVGSPYHLSFAHVGTDCGYYVYDGNEMEFVENTLSPRFIDIIDDEFNDEAVGDLANNLVRLFVNNAHTDAEKAVTKLAVEGHHPILIKTVPYGGIENIEEARIADDEETRRILNSDQIGMARIYIEKFPDELPTLESGKDPVEEVLRYLKEYDDQCAR